MSARWRKCVLAIAVLLLIGVAVTCAWPGRPVLVQYHSPAISLNGRPVTVSMLVPAGWEPQAPYIQPPGRTGVPGMVTIQVRPVERLTWLPGPLRRVLHATAEPDAMLEVFLGVPYDGRGKIYTSELAESDGRHVYVATGWPKSDGTQVMYFRSVHREFEATFRQMLDSIRVMR